MCFGFMMIVYGTLLNISVDKLQQDSVVYRMGDMKFDSRQGQETFSFPKLPFQL